MKKKGIGMYNFLLIRYALGQISEQSLLASAPQWLTRAQAREIIAHLGTGDEVFWKNNGAAPTTR